MADNFFGYLVPVGSTSLTIWAELRSSTTWLGETGITASTSGLVAAYWRQGGTPTSITLSALASITSVYSSGGFIEASATLQRGVYRLDVPNAAFASGADWVTIQVYTGTTYEFNRQFFLYSDPETAFADVLLNRDLAAVTVTNDRSPANALRLLRNKHTVASGTLTVYKENDSDSAWTATVTSTPGANPITAVDPA